MIKILSITALLLTSEALDLFISGESGWALALLDMIFNATYSIGTTRSFDYTWIETLILEANFICLTFLCRLTSSYKKLRSQIEIICINLSITNVIQSTYVIISTYVDMFLHNNTCLKDNQMLSDKIQVLIDN